MLFNNSKRVSEDLQKIRQVNLDPAITQEKEKLSDEEKKKAKELLKELTFKDYIAMVIAVFSIIVPYFLILIGVLAILLFLLYLFYFK